MAKTASSFARSKSSLKTQPPVLVLCEDSKSSLRYLEDANAYFRSFASVEVSHCGKTDPLGIVREAIAACTAKYEFAYCVIDRDTHPSFDDAMRLANQNSEKIALVVSYPCYEFWLLLHFGKTRKPYARAGKFSAGDLLVKDLTAAHAMMKGYEKGGSIGLFEGLLDRLPSAMKWSEQILAEAEQDGEMNPSTSLHRFIEKLHDLGKPEKISVA
jgi:hypothetical protein